MPQTPIHKGFEACYVNRLSLFANCSHSQTLVANSYRHHKDSIYLADILGQTQLSTVCMLLLRKCWCLPYPNTSCGTPSRIVLFDVQCFLDLQSNLLMLGRVQTCLTLLSLNRSLDKRLQFLGICRSGEDGAVAVNEVHGTTGIAGSVLAPHTVLVVQF